MICKFDTFPSETFAPVNVTFAFADRLVVVMSPFANIILAAISPTEKPPTEFNALIAIERSFYYYIYHYGYFKYSVMSMLYSVKAVESGVTLRRNCPEP